MKRAPISYRPSQWTKETRERFRQIEREFHVREFGEELARVNLDMTIEERHAYLKLDANHGQRSQSQTTWLVPDRPFTNCRMPHDDFSD